MPRFGLSLLLAFLALSCASSPEDDREAEQKSLEARAYRADERGRSREAAELFARADAIRRQREEAQEAFLGEVEQPQLLVQLGHAGGIRAGDFSPDGRLVATAATDDTVRLWERATGREIRRFQEPGPGINGVVFLPDGRSLLTATGNWTGEGRFVIHSGSMLRSVSAGEHPHALTEDAVHEWDVRTGRLLRRFLGHRAMVTAVAVSPDGLRIATASADGTARLWDTATGETIHRLEGHRAAVRAVAFSPDGRRLVTAGDDRALCLWDTATGTRVGQQADAFRITSVRFSADGNFLLTGSPGPENAFSGIGDAERRACLLEAGSGKLIRCEQAGEGSSVVFAPDGRRVIFFEVSWREKQRRIRIVDRSAGEERALPLPSFGGDLSLLAFSSGLGAFLVGGSEGAQEWALAGSGPGVRFDGRSAGVWSLAVAAGGRSIAIGGGDGVLHLWDPATGRDEQPIQVGRLDLQVPGPIGIEAVAFAAAGSSLLTTSSQGIVRVWDLGRHVEVRHFAGKTVWDRTMLSPDGNALLEPVPGDSALLVRDPISGEPRGGLSQDSAAVLAVSRDGRSALIQGDGEISLQSAATRRTVWRSPTQAFSAAFSPDGRRVAVGTEEGTAILFDAATGRRTARCAGPQKVVLPAVTFSADGRFLLTGQNDGLAGLWDAPSGKLLFWLRGHRAAITAVAFSPDGRFAATAANDSTTRLWNPSTGREICRLISFRDGTWAVVAPDGRFDSDHLESIPGLHWIMPDAPLAPLSPEVFLRDYYEPHLLPRLLAGEQLPPVRPLTGLNRVQPAVRIARIEPVPGSPGEVIVEVEAAGQRAERQRDGKPVVEESGVYDLRLFRDGQIVAVAPEDRAPSGETRTGTGLRRWREIHRVALDEKGRAQRFFAVRLPRRAGEVTFTAYAFNSDRVKSTTATRTFTAARPVPAAAGRAYVVTVGVSGNENPAWRLSYPANDARRLRSALSEALRSTGRYREVVAVPLVSGRSEDDREADEVLPVKDNLRTVFDLLAGRLPDPRRLAALPAVIRSRLAPARPEDLVVISWSGHGSTDAAGVFRLYPYDLGRGGEVPPERTLSSEELALWLRGVDAGEMALTLDACRSGAAAGPGFKPGPLGDSGLGQLSYDKGMLILAATQADNDAIGSGSLRHGLLTYALAREGLEAGKALRPGEPFALRAWLRYGRDRVPGLFQEKVAPASPEARVQEPVLFDFTSRD